MHFSTDAIKHGQLADATAQLDQVNLELAKIVVDRLRELFEEQNLFDQIFGLGPYDTRQYIRKLSNASVYISELDERLTEFIAGREGDLETLAKRMEEYVLHGLLYEYAVGEARAAVDALQGMCSCSQSSSVGADLPNGEQLPFIASFPFFTICRAPALEVLPGEPVDQTLPPSPINPGGQNTDSSETDVRAAFDPNDKIGPYAFGPSGFLQPGLLNYEIQFENDPDEGATLTAETVEITDALDDDLDLSTLEITGFGFNNFEFDVPAGLSNYETTVDLRPDGIDLLVPVQFKLDRDTRKLTASFASLDPLTGLVPDDIDAGFLPVNDKALHNGEGFIRYRVQPMDDLPSGTEIRNQASIVFDINAPIPTPETIHTIDRDKPTSTVTALPEAFGTANFMVDWSGEDDGGGSGINSYDLYVSRDDGPFQRVVTNTAETGFELTDGVSGSTYGFVTLARDNVGNVEPMPAVADTETFVIIGAWVNRVDVYDVDAKGGATALDALIIINELGRRSVSDPETGILTPLPPDGFAPPYYDVNEDRKATALDALRVINQLARLANAGGGEQVQAVSHPLTAGRTQTVESEAFFAVDESFRSDAKSTAWPSTIDSQTTFDRGSALTPPAPRTPRTVSTG